MFIYKILEIKLNIIINPNFTQLYLGVSKKTEKLI
jgi:hypothetical protein